MNVVGTRKPRSKVPKVRTFFDPQKNLGSTKNERQIVVILLFRKQKPVLFLLLWIFCFAASFCTIPIRFPDLPRSGLIFVRFLRTGNR